MIEKVLSGLGKVLDSGSREEFKWYDVDTKPLTKEAQEKLEEKFRSRGLFVKVINAGSALNRKEGREVQRIWLVEFGSEKELRKWEKEFEERRRRDHRFIGEQLDWFHVQEDLVGPGLPILHPRGMTIRRELIDFIRELNGQMGAEEVWTPHLARAVLWKVSGHYEHYRDKMFMWEQDGEEYGLKAMNCPIHIQVYRFQPRSYRDLPMRLAEFATVYRKEQSGELHGLSRVWSLTQDDHHYFVRPDQIEGEILSIIRAALRVYEVMGMDYQFNLSTRPDDSMGGDELWERAESALRAALDKAGIDYVVKDKEGAFYGPKIDVDVRDSMGRWWQLTTIQVDFNLPERFDLSYTDSDGSRKRPVIIHFALLGSIERFMSVLIEHTAGRLPLWLAPVQVRVLPVGDSHVEYAQEVVNALRSSGLRAELDEEGTLARRIRRAETEKVAVVAVVGDREQKAGTVDVRGRGQLKLDELREKLLLSVIDRKGF